MRLRIEIRCVNPVGLLLCNREVENNVASGDGVVFLLIETKDVGAVLSVGSKPRTMEQEERSVRQRTSDTIFIVDFILYNNVEFLEYLSVDFVDYVCLSI